MTEVVNELSIRHYQYYTPISPGAPKAFQQPHTSYPPTRHAVQIFHFDLNLTQEEDRQNKLRGIPEIHKNSALHHSAGEPSIVLQLFSPPITNTQTDVLISLLPISPSPARTQEITRRTAHMACWRGTGVLYGNGVINPHLSRKGAHRNKTAFEQTVLALKKLTLE